MRWFRIAFFTVVFYGGRVKDETTVKTWEKTRLQNLVRHKSGRYYARFCLNGKEVWKSLKTSHFSVAEARLALSQKEHRERRSQETVSSNARMTFGEAAKLHLQQVADDVNLKRRTRDYWRDIGGALLRSWPGLAESEIRRITPAACRDWSTRLAKSVSATRYNGAISYFRRVFEIVIESGVTASCRILLYLQFVNRPLSSFLFITTPPKFLSS